MLRGLLHSVEHHNFHSASKMKELALFMILRTLAISLFAVFTPIFFYSRGESLTNILVYFFVAYLTEAIFEIVSLRVYRKIGPKKTLCIGAPILILYFYMLTSLDQFGWPLWLLGLVVGISLAFFWQPYQYLFSRYKSQIHASSQVSIRTSVVAVLGALGPLIGGFAIGIFGPNNLIYVVIAILGLAVLLFLRGKDIEVKEQFDLRNLKIKKHKKEIISYMGYTLEETAAAAIWPLFIFLLVGTYQAVGLLTTLTLFLAVTITLAVGKFSDKHGRIFFIKEGSLMGVLINIGRAASTSLYHIFIINIFRSLSTSIFTSPFLSEYYLHADEEVRDEYVFLMEFFSDIARVLYFGTLLLVSLFLPIKLVLIIAFVISAVGAYLSGLMPPSKRDLRIQNKEIKLMPRPRVVKSKIKV